MAGTALKVAAAAAVALWFAHGVGGTGLDSYAAGATTASANERLAMRMAAEAGYGAGQRQCLDWLWTRESGFRLVWNYQGSGAFGIPQALPASKMASAGPDYMTDPATEIRWGLKYLAQRYGTPCNAWTHEVSAGWY